MQSFSVQIVNRIFLFNNLTTYTLSLLVHHFCPLSHFFVSLSSFHVCVCVYIYRHYTHAHSTIPMISNRYRLFWQDNLIKYKKIIRLSRGCYFIHIVGAQFSIFKIVEFLQLSKFRPSQFSMQLLQIFCTF